MLSLTSNRNTINKEIIRCRAEEGRWPRFHLLWEQHPAIIWMQNKLLSRFGRHQASCIHLRHLDPDERIVVGTGIIPNRKGQTVIQRWYGVRFLKGELIETLDLEQIITRTQFQKDHPNPEKEIDYAAVEKLFPETVECLTIHLSEARDEFRERTQPELNRQLAKLKSFLDSRTEQLELDFQQKIAKGLSSTQKYKREQKERAQRDIQKKHDDYKSWITDTMQTEDSPSIRIFTVFGNFDR
jgi:hypothetical protein